MDLHKATDPGVKPVLERITLDMEAKKLTGAMIVKEFLTQRLVPLESHSGVVRPRIDAPSQPKSRERSW